MRIRFGATVGLGSAMAFALVVAALPFLGGTTLPAQAQTDATYEDAVVDIVDTLGAAKSNITTSPADATALLYQAWDTYNDTLKIPAQARDPLTDGRATAAFQAAYWAIQAGDATEFAVQGQMIKKSNLRIAWLQVWHHLDADVDVAEADAWFRVLVWKFGWSPADHPGAAAMENITADHDRVDELKGEVYDAAMAQFASKVREEVAEVFLFWDQDDLATAREKAMEGLAYYTGMQEDVEQRLDTASRVALESWLRALVAYTEAEDRTAAEEARAAIVNLMNRYEGLTGLPEVLAILDALEFIEAEYEEAVAAEGGTIVDQGEYDETLLFLDTADQQWAEVRATVAASDPEVAEAVDQGLADLRALVVDLAPPSQVHDLVEELEALLAPFAAAGEELTPVEHLDRLMANVTRARDLYAQGQVEEAEEALANAYLQHFEPVEPDLAERNLELMEEIEIMVSVELRQLMQEGADLTAIDAKIAEIEGKVEEAKVLLQGGQIQRVQEIPIALLATLLGVIVAELVVILYLVARVRAVAPRGAEGP